MSNRIALFVLDNMLSPHIVGTYEQRYRHYYVDVYKPPQRCQSDKYITPKYHGKKWIIPKKDIIKRIILNFIQLLYAGFNINGKFSCLLIPKMTNKEISLKFS